MERSCERGRQEKLTFPAQYGVKKSWLDLGENPLFPRFSQDDSRLQCQKWKTGKSTLTPSMTENHVVVTILEPTHQSQSSPTIHYTNNEKLEGSRCCHLLESIRKHTILV